MHSVCLIVDLICISITLTIHNKQQQTNTQEITEIKQSLIKFPDHFCQPLHSSPTVEFNREVKYPQNIIVTVGKNTRSIGRPVKSKVARGKLVQ